MSSSKESKKKQVDWNEDDEILVAPRQEKTVVFLNVNNQIVIEQHCWPDENRLVFVSVEHADRLIAAIRLAVAASEGGES